MTARAGRLSGNVVQDADGRLSCAHCGQQLEGGPGDYVSKLPFYESGPEAAGPQVAADARDFVDVDVVFRQYICPKCATAFHTEVVPVGKDHVAI